MGFYDVRQMDIDTAEALVTVPWIVELEVAIGMLES